MIAQILGVKIDAESGNLMEKWHEWNMFSYVLY